MSTAVCIAGMHRWGTSMVSRLLQMCGASLAEQGESTRDITPDRKVVICLCHPLEVAGWLNQGDPNTSLIEGVDIWTTYYEQLLLHVLPDARLVTHVNAFLGEPDWQALELRRLLAFIGLTVSDETLRLAVATVTADRGHDWATCNDAAGLELQADVIALYASLCEEAGWDAIRARTQAAGPPLGAVLVEEFERLVEARRGDMRRLSAVQATVARLESELYYLRTVRNVRRVAQELVPADAPLLVVSHGDDDLLAGPLAAHFPQTFDGRYAGFYPASSLSAIGHLEALRARDARFLLVPRSERWWLDHYREFDGYLRQRYRLVLEDRHSCTLFALDQTTGAETAVDCVREAIATCEELVGRDPAILDWGSGLELGVRLPERTIFAPPSHAEPLPYLDGTVDLVVVPRDAAPARIAEAQRIARCAVVSVSAVAQTGGAEPVVTWRGDLGRGRPRVSLLVPGVDADPAPVLRSLREHLPRHYLGEILIAVDASHRPPSAIGGWSTAVAPLRLVRVSPGTSLAAVHNALAEEAAGDILVFLEPRAVLLPGWLQALTQAFRERDGLAVAGGRVLLPDGRLLHGGGRISGAGEIEDIVDGAGADEQLGRAAARRVRWCSNALMATPRQLFRVHRGFDVTLDSPRSFAADYCIRAGSEGSAVLCQPDAVLVLLDHPRPEKRLRQSVGKGATRLSDTSAAGRLEGRQ